MSFHYFSLYYFEKLVLFSLVSIVISGLLGKCQQTLVGLLP